MRAVGYFRENASTKGETIGRQNRRFLDFCEAQGYEVATTFAEEAKSTNNAAFSQLIDYLKKPEKGFITVVAPSPQALADDAVIAAARCLQIERLGASVNFMDGENGNAGDAMGAMVDNWSAGRNDASRDKMRAALRSKAVRGEVLGRPPYGYHVGRATAWSPWKTKRWSCATSSVSTCTKAWASA